VTKQVIELDSVHGWIKTKLGRML